LKYVYIQHCFREVSGNKKFYMIPLAWIRVVVLVVRYWQTIPLGFNGGGLELLEEDIVKIFVIGKVITRA
jgi:hypothetical protein